MNRIALVTLLTLLGAATVTGCSTREVATGTAAGAAGYEYSNKRAMEQLKEDYEAGRITQEEYEKRKQEIESRSVIY